MENFSVASTRCVSQSLCIIEISGHFGICMCASGFILFTIYVDIFKCSKRLGKNTLRMGTI